MPDETRYVAAIGPLYNVGLVVTAVAFTAIAWFNGLEMTFTTVVTFKKRGTYFYSLLVTNLGILCYSASVFCLIFARNANTYGYTAGIDLGWTCMVTGQSLVLWSRLHLVCRSQWKLRAVLAMIIVDGVLCHGTQWICSMLAINKQGILNPEFAPFKYAEKVTLCIFFVQEVIISGVYLWEAVRVLRVSVMVKKSGQRRRMQNLIAANIAILILDIALIALEFAALWGVWCTFKGFAYSVKIKMEFAILNELRNSVVGGNGPSYMTGDRYGNATKVDDVAGPAGIHQSDVPLSHFGPHATAVTTQPYAGQGGTLRSADRDQITKTTEFHVSNLKGVDGRRGPMPRAESKSSASSETYFADKGA